MSQVLLFIFLVSDVVTLSRCEALTPTYEIKLKQSRMNYGESSQNREYVREYHDSPKRGLVSTSFDALSFLYTNTSGVSWTTNTNWLNAEPCPSGSWFAITCSGSEVISLSLGTNALQGTLPSQIGKLTALRSIYLQRNTLSGSLPSEIGLLTSLTANFEIGSNGFTNVLPSEIGLFIMMTDTFSINSNYFSGTIPSEIGLMTGLRTYLQMNKNEFTGMVPSEIGQFTSLLSEFYLFSNQLTSLPSEIGLLTSFTTGMQFASNNFMGNLPSQIGQLIDFNQNFVLSGNRFSGSLPSQIGLFSKMLYNFDLESNLFSGLLPSQIGQLTSMTSLLDISANSFSGSLPSQIGQLTIFSGSLIMSLNHFNGSFPSEIGQLSKLESFLRFRYNSFSGSFPSEIGQLTSMFYQFDFWVNSFTGSIPSQLGLLSKMGSFLYLNSNLFSGFIPSQLGQLTSMYNMFKLSTNLLCGEIPSQVSALSLLVVSNFDITTSNSLGTPCCETIPAVYTCTPTFTPTFVPTSVPSRVTSQPTVLPSFFPTLSPSFSPSLFPTQPPTTSPTTSPTPIPTLIPTSSPTFSPTITCLPGTSFDGTGCITCGIGYFTDFISPPYPTNCTLCPSGQYNIAAGESECIYCASGKISSEDRTFCKDCEAGEYSYNDEECVACETGKYAPQALSDSCLTCAAGSRTNNATKATTCSACDAGTYSSNSSVECLSCSRGSYSLSGQSFCFSCEAGKYAAAAGSSACSSCAFGYSSDVKASSCDYAITDYYLAYPNKAASSCPSHAECDGGLWLPVPETGYWVDRSSYKYAGDLYKCSRLTCNIEDDDGDRSCWYVSYFNDSSASNDTYCTADELQCLKGSFGPLCGSCISGYVYRGATSKCETCSDVQAFGSIVLIVSIGIAGLTLLLWYLQLSGLIGSITDITMIRFALNFESGSLKVAWVTYQIIVSASFNLDVTFPSPFLDMLSFLTIFSFDFLSLECLNGNDSLHPYYISVYLWSLGPILIMFLACFVGGVRYLLLTQNTTPLSSPPSSSPPPSPPPSSSPPSSPSSSPLLFFSSSSSSSPPSPTPIQSSSSPSSLFVNEIEKLINQHVWFFLFLSYLVLPPVSSKQLQVFDCIQLESGKRYLRSDTSIDCESTSYQNFSFIIIFFIFLYQLIPIIWFVLLYRQKHILNPKQSNSLLDLKMFQEIENVKLSNHFIALKFLFQDYKPSYWWFEIADMYRRIIFIGILPLVSIRTSIRSSFGVLLAIISAITIREAQPYLYDFTNVIANIAQVTILLTYYSALCIDTDSMITFGLGDYGIGLFLVIINSIVFLTVVRLAIANYKTEQHEKQWRQALSTQELMIVKKVMGEEEENEEKEGEFHHNELDSERYEIDKSEPITAEQMLDQPGVKEMSPRRPTKKKKTDQLTKHLLQPTDVFMVKRVGAGAFGEVFKGTCMGETVAIKTMIDVTEDNVKEFKAEIMLTAVLRHPNIVNFVGACWGKELMCLVLEWVAKGSLRDLLEAKDLRWDLRWNDPLLRLASDVARGMKYLHCADFYDEKTQELKTCILHRDLKPDNALVSEFIAAKLADFGTSRAKGEEDVTMTAVGTPLYVAPEIARGELYDEKVDVYSFGLTLMEMCVEGSFLEFIGKRWMIAFNKKKIPKQPMRLIRPMTEDGWRPVTDENPISFAPPTINSLIVRCCSHDSKLRPSFEEILDELNGPCKVEIDASNFTRQPNSILSELTVTDSNQSNHNIDDLASMTSTGSSTELVLLSEKPFKGIRKDLETTKITFDPNDVLGTNL